MKKFLTAAGTAMLILLAGCSDEGKKQNETGAASTPAETQDFEKRVFDFDAGQIKEGCEVDSEMVCAINLFVKCSINPKTTECLQAKNKLPKFVFMEDESLGRPTKQSYRILKMKAIAGGAFEVYTESQCDGQWFGLCRGTIIYVMQPGQRGWIVNDVYARESI